MWCVRVVTKTGISGETMVIAFIFLGRVSQIVAPFGDQISILTIHRLLVVAMMVAAKYHDDQFLNNHSWALVGGGNPID
jgi:hypothetical protein